MKRQEAAALLFCQSNWRQFDKRLVQLARARSLTARSHFHLTSTKIHWDLRHKVEFRKLLRLGVVQHCRPYLSKSLVGQPVLVSGACASAMPAAALMTDQAARELTVAALRSQPDMPISYWMVKVLAPLLTSHLRNY